MKGRILFAAGLLATGLLAGCSSTPSKPAASPTPAAQAATYACPMGCEGSESAQPGKCPVCGMDLEKKS